MLLRVGQSLTGSSADAEDLVQETLIRAYRAMEQFDGAHPRAWLVTILRNTASNVRRCIRHTRRYRNVPAQPCSRSHAHTPQGFWEAVMTSIAQMWECRRTARNLQRFLDRDPSAPLSDEDRRRVEIHLQECEKCATLSAEYRILHQWLDRLGESMEPAPEAVQRVRLALDRALD